MFDTNTLTRERQLVVDDALSCYEWGEGIRITGLGEWVGTDTDWWMCKVQFEFAEMLPLTAYFNVLFVAESLIVNTVYAIDGDDDELGVMPDTWYLRQNIEYDGERGTYFVRTEEQCVSLETSDYESAQLRAAKMYGVI